ncbi:Na+-dependent transporters of the SNF family [Legionella busanensis]|uniref:Na+-dependent transporters of the SNF family n=1 Tax=Legionella busanensis TaxID=190655 RepID=A0A378JGJ9_9GAMM|nr:hypothetical protein [Legionella busanensis]STX49951.1 Na+-dependent transporters of the SNF family [Legionella busanensis]
MDNKILKYRAQWDSNSDYLLVTIGSVIGLGNIFQFPFFVAKFGGIFILVYFFCELFISIPLVLAEFFIGRRAKQNPVGAFSLLAMESGANYRWRWLGWICFTILVLTLGYYCLNVSAYLSSLFGLNQLRAEIGQFLIISPITSLLSFLYFFIFLALTMVVVARGINRGLEKISRIAVPLFFIVFFLLALYASYFGSFKNAILYLIQFTHPITSELLLSALAYAFFKLNTAMGSMIVYGSYLPATTRLGKSTLIIVGFDLIASLLSYFIIFPILLAKGNITQLSHLNLDMVLQAMLQLSGGFWIAIFFLLGTVLASWMPAIAFAESAAVTIIERFSLKRLIATSIITLLAIIIGALIIFTTHLLPVTWPMSEVVQELAGQILTPISAFLIAIFVGWRLNQKVAQTELDFGPKLFATWQFLIRYVVPILLVIVFIYLLWV